jgi:hypothetical protein
MVPANANNANQPAKPKLSVGQRVLVKATLTSLTGESWGVRVLDPDYSAEIQRRDRESGDVLTSAGEMKLYSDLREYSPTMDGGDALIRITRLQGKASYLAVRGAGSYAPQSLIEGQTPHGRKCWFRVYDVVAVLD